MRWLAVAGILALALLVQSERPPGEAIRAQSRGPAALTGVVSSVDEGPMEGASVS